MKYVDNNDLIIMLGMEELLMNEIRISVLVPVYNVEKFVAECIESVINQSSTVFEMIIVDDGSTDNSGLICDYYARKYHFIKVFHRCNEGLLSARRYAISKAHGNWLVFLDSDDTFKPNAIETIKQLIKQYNPDCIIYGLDRVSDGKIVKNYIPECVGNQLISRKNELYSFVFTNSALNSLCRKAVKSELITDDYSPFYNISLSEDLLQSIEIYKKGNLFLFYADSLYNYRVNESSMTKSIKINNYKVDYTVREKVLELLIEENVFDSREWSAYHSFSLKLFSDNIKMILLFGASKKECEDLFTKISETDYYKNYISKLDLSLLKGFQKVIVKSFISKKYSILYALSRVLSIKRIFKSN